MGMNRQEILATRYGELVDMISCLAVYNGTAEEKKKVSWSLTDIINLK